MKTGLFSIPVVAAFALVVASACVPDEPKQDDAGEETGDGDGDQGDGDGDPGDGDGDPGDGDGDPGDGDGDGTTAIEAACAAACEVFEECVAQYPQCVSDCVAQHVALGDDEACLAAELELTECIAGLDCAGVEQFLDAEPPYPCQAEDEASCGGPGGECGIGVGSGGAPGECSVTETCDGQPERSVVCDGQSCTCYIDELEVGGCSNPVDICGMFGTAAIDACCN